MKSCSRWKRSAEQRELSKKCYDSARRGDDHAVRRLLEAGAKADGHKDKASEKTALIASAAAGHVHCVRVLLQAGGAKADAKDSSGNTSLSWSAYHGHVAVIRELLAAHADPDVRDRFFGKTALVEAVRGGHEEAVQLLLEAKADPALKDCDGKAAMDHAMEALQQQQQHSSASSSVVTIDQAKRIVAMLSIPPAVIARQARLNRAVYHAVHMAKEDEEVEEGGKQNGSQEGGGGGKRGRRGKEGKKVAEQVTALLAAGAKPDWHRGKVSGKTALLEAVCKQGHLASVRALLAGGADKEATDYAGHTALLEAAVFGRVGAVKVLLFEAKAFKVGTRRRVRR